jgi:hypothetical protein
VSNGVDNIVYSFLWFWRGDNCFFIVCTCGSHSRWRQGVTCGLGTGRGGILVTGLFWTVPGHVPLLFAEEASSFRHESSFLFFTKGVSGTDGVYVHRIWVARGRASSLSALSKAMLPLVSCSQVSLVSHLQAKGENGFLGKILAHFISCHLLPLWHGVWPYVTVHDCIERSWP